MSSEFVSVPRELLERMDFCKDMAVALKAAPELRALLAQPAADPDSVTFYIDGKEILKLAGLAEFSGCKVSTAPVEIDERAAFEEAAKKICLEVIGRFVPARSADGSYRNQTTKMLHYVWQARAALERKP